MIRGVSGFAQPRSRAAANPWLRELLLDDVDRTSANGAFGPRFDLPDRSQQ
jgi:hypothetical protein